MPPRKRSLNRINHAKLKGAENKENLRGAINKIASNRHGYNYLPKNYSRPASPISSSECSHDTNLEVVDLHCLSLQQYLLGKPIEILEKCYEYPSICLAVYCELTEYAKQYVIRTLYIDQPIPQAVITSWGMKEYSGEQVKATDLLKKLCIWKEASVPGGLLAWGMNESFQLNLKIALLGNENSEDILTNSSCNFKLQDANFLKQYALARWSSLLHYMVRKNTSIDLGAHYDISPDAVDILLRSKLMRKETNSITITRQGFQFLLLDTYSQVRYFMWVYLDRCEEKGYNLPETISILFQLSYTTLGLDCQLDALSTKMLTFIQHLREFGLVFQRKRKEKRYYPTHLVNNLTNYSSKLLASMSCALEEKDKGYIVVETNHRVYAYTQSPLKIAIVALFTELQYRFSHMVIGVLTRESVQQAYRGGLTAHQIITYLEQYANSTMKTAKSHSSRSVLPLTVVDQLKLWEFEKNRLTVGDGIIYNQFLSVNDFKTLRDYARSIGVLVWENERSRTMVITEDGHDDVNTYWNRYVKEA